MEATRFRVTFERVGIGVVAIAATIIGLGGVVDAFSQTAPKAPDAAKSFFAANVGSILEEYAELLAIPNRASDDRNIRRNAEWIRDALDRRGVRAELLEVS
ncbi:MAG: hypothetical protein KAJ17_06035, partial [Candidatus Krumholzibacteria bacterium]|nr:hypothetical protein [Candidatus Krumholzibacteria bacterium]